MSAAAKAIGMTPTTIYRLRKNNADFREQTDLAIEIAIDALEEEAYKRATEGRSDTLLMFLLRAHRPEKYRESYRHELSGPNGGAIPMKAYIGFDPARWNDDDVVKPNRTFEVVDGETVAIDDPDASSSKA